MNTLWYEPFSNSFEDKLAVERALSFYMNWYEKFAQKPKKMLL